LSYDELDLTMDLREARHRPHQRHPWEQVRARFFTRLLLRHAAPRKAVRVLDVGAGDGYFSRQLLAQLPAGSGIVCHDPGYDAEWEQQSDAGGALVFRRERPADRFDWVLLLDTLEHVADDLSLLRELSEQALDANGVMLVAVPAFDALYTAHDAALGHRRRYTVRQLVGRMQTAGLWPALSGGLFASLLAPRALAKLGELARGQRAAPPLGPPAEVVATDAARWTAGPTLTWTLTTVLDLDARLCAAAASRAVNVPGLSAWVLARRRAT
jgi:hypothetical protein